MGHVPKRDADKAGHRTKAERADKVARVGRVVPPKDSPSWTPEARDWYRSLAASGQSDFYEPSDWQYALWIADLLTDYQREPGSGALLKQIMDGMTKLGVTENDRRRMHLEVERVSISEEDTVREAAMSRYRDLAKDD